MFFYAEDENARQFKVRKDVFVRLFNEADFVSKDRTQRFIPQRKISVKVPETSVVKEVVRKDLINELDWIIIDNFNGVARVLEFKNIQPESKKIAAARVRNRFLHVDKISKACMGMLLQFYVVKDDGQLSLADTSHVDDTHFVPLRHYKWHVPVPTKIDNNFMFVEDKLEQIKQVINIYAKRSFATSFGKTTQTKIDPDYTPSSKMKNLKTSKRLRKKQDDSDDSSDTEMNFLKKLKQRKRGSKE